MALAIEPLDPRRHDRDGFRCGVQELDRYLHALAMQHRRKRFSRTFVLVDKADAERILGYYCLSAAELRLADLTAADRKHLPTYPIPAARLGRLAVAQSVHAQGYGGLLLQDAVGRCLAAGAEMGLYALLADAKNDAAARFYAHFGFRRCADRPLMLYLPLGKNG